MIASDQDYSSSESAEEDKLDGFSMSSADLKVDAEDESEQTDQVAEFYKNVQYIGPLTEDQRLQKVHNYWRKKLNKSRSNKYHYVCRQQVAEKRLRIKGRFVTKEQACQILGITQNELLDNVKIQELLTAHASNPMKVTSLVEDRENEGQMIKVRNFQALIDPSYKHVEQGDDDAQVNSSLN